MPSWRTEAQGESCALALPSRTVPSFFLALPCCPGERDREFKREQGGNPEVQHFPGEATGPVCNAMFWGWAEAAHRFPGMTYLVGPFPAMINHMTAFVHRSPLRGGRWAVYSLSCF